MAMIHRNETHKSEHFEPYLHTLKKNTYVIFFTAVSRMDVK